MSEERVETVFDRRRREMERRNEEWLRQEYVRAKWQFRAEAARHIMAGMMAADATWNVPHTTPATKILDDAAKAAVYAADRLIEELEKEKSATN